MTVILSILGAVFLATTYALVTDEARAWLPHIARWLVRSAARRVPGEERVRYEEEWLAELAAWSDRPLSAVLRAAHIRWHARAMRACLVTSRPRVHVVERMVGRHARHRGALDGIGRLGDSPRRVTRTDHDALRGGEHGR